MAWGAGDGVVAGHGSGAVLSEDVVLPPQSDSWMRAAVQQELLREQQQQQLHDQAVVHQYQQQQQQYAAAVSTAAATGTAAAPGGAGLSFGGVAPPGLDMSQQPLLNAQVWSQANCSCAILDTSNPIESNQIKPHGKYTDP